MAEYRHLSIPDPEWKDFPINIPTGTRIEPITPWLRDKVPITHEAGLDIYEIDIKARDAHAICCRVYSKVHEQSAFPLLVYNHSGGYVKGSLETDDRCCRLLARELDVVVLSVEYRLAPENKFPKGFEDCFDVVRWCTSRQLDLGVDLNRGFILGGTSAGANIAAGIAHLARDEKLKPPITGLVLLAGSFCSHEAILERYEDRLLSIVELTDAPGLTLAQIDYFAREYGAPPTDPRYTTLLFDSHAGLAKKAYVSVCGWDPKRDDSFLFEQLLKEAGTETVLDVNPGLPHAFWTDCPELPVSIAWEKRLVEGVRWMLE
ncbi:hypothetical protein EJ08DRAFT_607082 [Tothia fuscella]|uniref:Alpha/beta hydrolase fold-3 domain-containing protein n=1 Tax=Tothia fuscella TaxID=1048955 RepID=A0A9P4U2B9_9PEZI|nr:hypothetical protein EJ08DRAFT_607082 [Tothia fuscella]